ncbi:protein BTG3-like [Scyliorhinus canicula]|uniref:protein BTG3-like n=1 Tax=Scyliorhinus canicula TaxID=7830 RepID=UPI0018F2A7C8|nr:protein BTG3-like [Scyliorhinus canicula]XP_038670845.1 protein BTG3-like [Scyliorhinus canicula]
MMKEEIGAAVVFLISLVRRRSGLQQEMIEAFGEKLRAVLHKKYQGHWYPTNPSKGQAYRCIRINRKQKTDPSLLLACQGCDLDYNQLRLPKEITLWIDPREVWCRSGEGSQPFTVAQFEEDSWKPEWLECDQGSESSDCNTSDYHSGSSTDDEDRVKAQTEEQTPNTAAMTHKVSGGFSLPLATWPQYPHKLVQCATFYQPVPLISYYLMPRLDNALRPPPGFLLPQGQPHRSKIGKRHK